MLLYQVQFMIEVGQIWIAQSKNNFNLTAMKATILVEDENTAHFYWPLCANPQKQTMWRYHGYDATW